VSRAHSARSNNADEIPLASRSKPLRGPSSSFLRLVSLLSVLLGISAILFSLTFIPRFRGLNPFIGIEGLPSSDGRLLGHYPYAEATSQDLISIYPGLEIHRDTYNSLRAMRASAALAGVELILLSGYRSIDLQKQIFYGRKSARNQIAIERAKVSAPPGYSEHSTGYAIDLGDATKPETDLEVEFETTKAFRWLQKNAAKYHFVMSFPKGNSQKVSYEPWHWRFEGTVESLRQFEAANESRRSKESSD